MKLNISRKILSKTIAQDIVPVVPMGEPTGDIFHMNFSPYVDMVTKEKIPTITGKIKPIKKWNQEIE